MNALLPIPSARGRRARIEALVAHLIDLLEALDDTDGDACEAEDVPPPADAHGAGDADDAEAECSPLTLGAALAPRKRLRRRAAA